MLDIQEPFQTYKDDVYRLALSYTKSRADAEDVCQTVFLKLMEQPSLPENIKAWLMQVTANQCRNLLKSSWWRKSEALDDTLAAAVPEDLTDIYRAVMALSPKYRVVVYLHYYEQCATKEIADLLHISQSAVTTRLSRARQMLKLELQEEYR